MELLLNPRQMDKLRDHPMHYELHAQLEEKTMLYRVDVPQGKVKEVKAIIEK